MGREPKKRGGHLLRLLLEGKMELADFANERFEKERENYLKAQEKKTENRKMRINVKKEIWEGLKRKSE